MVLVCRCVAAAWFCWPRAAGVGLRITAHSFRGVDCGMGSCSDVLCFLSQVMQLVQLAYLLPQLVGLPAATCR
jgi:hypothetical protein